MSTLVFLKLLAIFVIVAIGWLVGKLRWLGEHDPARTLANAAYYMFVPALLFRTTARIDFKTMPWGTLVAIFVPMVAMLLIVYAWQRRGLKRGTLPPAGPSVRAITAVFGNSVQVGIPMAAALFGETGLAIHLAIVSLHALVLLSLATTLVELDIARHDHADTHLASTLLTTARNTIVHPVVLPVLAGMTWNALGLPLPAVADEILQTLGQAVVPLCLVLIGMSLAYYGVQGAVKTAVGLSVLKLLVLPALVLGVAHWGLSPERPAARRRRDDGRDADRQQRADLRAALSCARSRDDCGHGVLDARVRGHRAALADGAARAGIELAT